MKYGFKSLAVIASFLFAIFAHLAVHQGGGLGVTITMEQIKQAQSAVLVDSYRYEESAVTRVQAGSIALTGTSGTYTLPVAVDTSRTVLVYGGAWSSQITAQVGTEDNAYITLTNSTTVTATRNTAAGTLTIYFTAVEWNAAAIQSIQYGTVQTTTTNTTGTAAISSVTTTNAAVGYLGFATTITNARRDAIYHRVALTSSTQVTATRHTGISGTTTVSFYVVEFKAGFLNSNTQQGDANWTSSNTTADATISSVGGGSTWLVWGGETVSTASMNNGANIIGWLSSATTVTAQSAAAQTAGHFAFTAVEFKSTTMRGKCAFAYVVVADGTTSGDYTSCAMTTLSKAFFQYLGNNRTNGTVGGTQASRSEMGGEIINNTTVRMYLGTDAGATDIAGSFEVMEVF